MREAATSARDAPAANASDALSSAECGAGVSAQDAASAVVSAPEAASVASAADTTAEPPASSTGLLSFLPPVLLDAGFWAATLNVVGMCGYVVADGLRGFLAEHSAATDALYLFLALLFLLDALLYKLSWGGYVPAYAARVGDFGNILGSAGYVVTALLTYLDSYFFLSALAIFINGGLAWVFFLDALAYAWAYYDALAIEAGSPPLSWGDLRRLAGRFCCCCCAADEEHCAAASPTAGAASPTAAAAASVPRPTLWTCGATFSTSSQLQSTSWGRYSL